MSHKEKDWWGYGLTFLYIGIMIGIAVSKWNEVCDMKLNEIGDFLAGVFAPVAFLWLILGYIQQREELKQNTKELENQKEELKKQAEATEKLIEIEKRKLEPVFNFNINNRQTLNSAEKDAGLDWHWKWEMIIKNIGEIASEILVEERGWYKAYISKHNLGRNEDGIISFLTQDINDFIFGIKYKDINNITHSKEYKVENYKVRKYIP